MIQFGAHCFLWVGNWDEENGNHAIAEAGRTGFDFLEITILRPDEFNAPSHRDALARAGIDARCSLSLPAAAHMPHYPDRALVFLKQVFEQMDAIGSRYLCGCIGYALGTLTGEPPTEAEHTNVRDGLGLAAAEAQKRGITLALEACNRYETYMYNSLADTRELVLSIGADNLRLQGDTWHMNIEEESFDGAIRGAADVLDYLHMSESHRGLVGSGTVKWDEVWRGLKDVNYDGALVLESFAAINPDLRAATCLWRPPNESPQALSSQGLAFLKAGAREHGLI